jgi:hypothetical protein
LLFSSAVTAVIINTTAAIVSGGVSADRFRTNATTSVTFTLTGACSSTTLSNGQFVVNVMKL